MFFKKSHAAVLAASLGLAAQCLAGDAGQSADRKQADSLLDAARKGDKDASATLRKLAADGNFEAQFALCKGAWVPYGSNIAQPKEAKDWCSRVAPDLRQRAENGDVVAQADMGDYEYEAYGGPIDHHEAARWYNKAQNAGNVHAASALARLLESDFHSGKTDSELTAVRLAHWAAEHGDADAERATGSNILAGRIVPRDVPAAIVWLEKSAQQGNVIAQANLGELYLEGTQVKQDYARAAKWFRAAADQDNPESQRQLALLYRAGTGVPHDDALAAQWLVKAAKHFDRDAAKILGEMYEVGIGVPQDAAQAKHWREQGTGPITAMTARAPGPETPQGQVNLSHTYTEGRGKPKDDAQAYTLMRRAADQGYSPAEEEVGRMFAEGRGVAASDATAISWWRAASDQGNIEAKIDLARAYAEGRGITQNDTEAVRFYRVAAQHGHVDAALALADLYANGPDTIKSDTEAAQWVRFAADYGDVAAFVKLAEMAEAGKGMAADPVAAFAAWREAAERGNIGARVKLAYAYADGHGVKKDRLQAYAWAQFAHARNMPAWDAGHGLTKLIAGLEQSMSAKEKKLAWDQVWAFEGEFIESEYPDGCRAWVLGQKIYNAKWDGSCRAGFADGQGALTVEARDNNGFTDEGSFVNGRMQGRGKRTWLNGDHYEGEFVDGHESGQGTFAWHSGATYTGTFANGQPNGRGVLVFNEQQREGLFVDGKPVESTADAKR